MQMNHNQEQEDAEKARRAALEAAARAAIAEEVASAIKSAPVRWLPMAALRGAYNSRPALTLSGDTVTVELEHLGNAEDNSLVSCLVDLELPGPELRAQMVQLAREFNVPPPNFDGEEEDAEDAFVVWFNGSAEVQKKLRAALLDSEIYIDEDYLYEAIDELLEGSRPFDADVITAAVLKAQLDCLTRLDVWSLWRVLTDGTLGVELCADARRDVSASVAVTGGSSALPDASDRVTGYLMSTTGFGDEAHEPVADLAAEWGVELPEVLDEDGDEVTDDSAWLAAVGAWFVKTPEAIAGARKTLLARAADEDGEQEREEIVRRWLEEQERD